MENRKYNLIKPMDSTEALNRGYTIPEGVGIYNKVHGWEVKFENNELGFVCTNVNEQLNITKS